MLQKSRPSSGTVHIFGSLTIQNELLSPVIEESTCCPCMFHPSEESLAKIKGNTTAGPRSLMLVDCHGLDLKGVELRLNAIKMWQEYGAKSALFNISTRLGTHAEQVAIKKGIDGVFFENNPLSLFKKGVSAILDGDRWFSRETLLQLLRQGQPAVSRLKSLPGQSLTRREWEILNVLSTGASNEKIAASLNISKHTVKTHMHNIFKKTGASNRIQASMWASQNKPDFFTSAYP